MLVVSGWPLTFGYYRWDSLLSMKPLRSFVHVNLCHPGALISPQYWSFHFHFLLKIGADVKQAMWCECFDIFSITTFSLSLSIKEWIRCEAGSASNVMPVLWYLTQPTSINPLHTLSTSKLLGSLSILFYGFFFLYGGLKSCFFSDFFCWIWGKPTYPIPPW